MVTFFLDLWLLVYLFISDCVLCVNGEDFDSGVDDIHTPRQCIVWNMNKNTHIYPEYVVSFKVSSDLNLLVILESESV